MANLAVAAIATIASSIVASVTASASALPQATQTSPYEYAQSYGSTVAEAAANAYDVLLSEFYYCNSPILVASGDAGSNGKWAEVKAMCYGS